MSDIKRSSGQSFQNLESARKYALEQPGNERIRNQKGQDKPFIVEAHPETKPTDTSDKSINTVGYLIDTHQDGAKTPDQFIPVGSTYNHDKAFHIALPIDDEQSKKPTQSKSKPDDPVHFDADKKSKTVKVTGNTGLKKQDWNVKMGTDKVGGGFDGKIKDHEYHIGVTQQFDQQGLGQGVVRNDNTNLEFRYKIGSNTVSVANKYSYSTGGHQRELSYQRDVAISDSLKTHVTPFIRGGSQQERAGGLRTGLQKDLGNDLKAGINTHVDSQRDFGASVNLGKKF